jgi:hypothetical protein
MMIGGPVGAAIGGAAGLVVGAFKQLSEEAKETREGLMSLRLGAASSTQSISSSRQDDAFYTTLKYKTKEDRQAAIDERIEQLAEGNGKYSIKSISYRQRRRIIEGLTDTEAYKRDEMMLGQQKSRLTSLFGNQSEESKTSSYNPLDASAVTDCLGAMGGIVGRQVDIADVNKDMLSELKRINANIERMGGYRPDEALEDTRVHSAFNI